MASNGHSTHGNGVANGTDFNRPPIAKKLRVSPKEELSDFDTVFPVLLKECLNEGGVSQDKEIGDAITHFLSVCKLNDKITLYSLYDKIMSTLPWILCSLFF